MNRRRTFCLVAALLLLAAAKGLRAQSAAGDQAAARDILESPQNMATQGRFLSAADDFIMPDSYTSAGIDKWFAYISYDSWFMATFGYAINLGGVYLGAYYGGNFWSGLAEFNPTERYEVGWPGGPRTVPVYTSLPEISSSSNDNRFAVLVGFMDMGIRLQYGTTWQSFDETKDFAITGSRYYKSVQTSYGVISPQIEWAMARPLLANGIQPYVGLTFNIARDNWRFDQYTGPGTSEGEQIARSANYLNPELDIALGGYTFYSKDNFEWSADFDYLLDLYIYDNEYSYLDGNNKYQHNKVKGLHTETSISEDSYVSNRFRPMLAGSWSAETLALKTKLNLPMTIINMEKTPLQIGTDGSLKKNGTHTSDTSFVFAPSLELGVQWKIFKERLFINAGGKVETSILAGYGQSTNYQNGSAEPNSNMRLRKNEYGETATALTLGLTFNPANSLSVEAVCGIEGDNSVDIFRPGGLFRFSRILVSVKF